MAPYLDPIKLALITFPLAAIFLTVPFAIYNYRKYGYINKWRTLVLFSFLLFMITAFYLVILPLPETRDIKSLQGPDVKHWNLKPFQFLRDIIRETKVDIRKPKTYIGLLRERAFLQGAFNILLLFPLGVYLRYYFRKSFKKTLLITFLVSLFFEITQLTGIYGIYNAPYRLFDIDDLFLNTLGGAIGYGITPIFSYFLPKSEELDEKAGGEKYRLGYVRRFIAFVLIDLSLIRWLISLLKLNNFYAGVLFISYFTILPLISRGRTLGLFLTNMKLMGEREDLSLKNTFLRSFSFYLVFFGINIFLNKINEMNMSGEYGRYLIFLYLGIFAFNLFLLVHCLYSIVRRQRFFYERISNTYLKVDRVK